MSRSSMFGIVGGLAWFAVGIFVGYLIWS